MTNAGKREKKYFELHRDSLRVLGRWAADCAEKALPIFEESVNGDTRPRDAIEGIRAFADGGRRNASLRKLALAAFRASIETKDLAASAAARAASLAAASAFTHPLIDVQQTKHIVGPPAYAALAIEIKKDHDPGYGGEVIRFAVESARIEICEILSKMPKREEGRGRINYLMSLLDIGLRDKYMK